MPPVAHRPSPPRPSLLPAFNTRMYSPQTHYPNRAVKQYISSRISENPKRTQKPRSRICNQQRQTQISIQTYNYPKLRYLDDNVTASSETARVIYLHQGPAILPQMTMNIPTQLNHKKNQLHEDDSDS